MRGPVGRFCASLGVAFAAVVAFSRLSLAAGAASGAVSFAWLAWTSLSLARDFSDSAERALNELTRRAGAEAAELARDRDRFLTILDNIVEAVAAVDAGGRVIFLNPAFCQLFQLSPAAVGLQLFEVLRHPKLTTLLAEVLKEGRVRVDEVELFGAEENHFEAHVVPLLGARQRGALVLLHEITRIRKLEKVRRDFVANVSHELRTPLASIRGFAETLRDGALDDNEHRLEFVEAIEKDAQRLAALVDDLLDLSAIESGQRPPRLENAPLLEIAREAGQAMRPLAERRRITIEVESASGPQARVDRRQMRQVFTNLIDNAIKFNRDGGRVTVRAETDGKTATVFVSDTGVGIPAEDLPRVFERFYRVDKARSREQGGTGLGLAIVKHLVEAHRGGVAVQSRPDEGSVFRFTIPV